METIQSIRLSHSKAPQFSADQTHEAVIVQTYTISGKSNSFGVQYWTQTQIATGRRSLDGGGTAKYLERLYPRHNEPFTVNWISVDNGLPKERQRVLVMQNPNTTATREALMAEYRDGNFKVCEAWPPSQHAADSAGWSDVIRWMPLPAVMPEVVRQGEVKLNDI